MSLHRLVEDGVRRSDEEASCIPSAHSRAHPFTDALKRRRDVRAVRVTERSRDALPERLAAEPDAAAAARRPR
jgi:hypothetical protein